MVALPWLIAFSRFSWSWLLLHLALVSRLVAECWVRLGWPRFLMARTMALGGGFAVLLVLSSIWILLRWRALLRKSGVVYMGLLKSWMQQLQIRKTLSLARLIVMMSLARMAAMILLGLGSGV